MSFFLRFSENQLFQMRAAVEPNPVDGLLHIWYVPFPSGLELPFAPIRTSGLGFQRFQNLVYRVHEAYYTVLHDTYTSTLYVSTTYSKSTFLHCIMHYNLHKCQNFGDKIEFFALKFF